MAFTVQIIPESVRPQLTYVKVTFFSQTKWAIDKERDAFMVLTNSYGGGYEGTQVTDYYTLNWRGELIEIIADLLEKTFSEEGATANWRVHWLKIPANLQERRDEVMQLVRDAFRAVGTCFNGERFVSVNVNFDLKTEH